ncbi:MAG: hypothetical protein IT540_00290, partial [Hyphomicrobium sp.]|nr:hypothetical protein [Hyphomicrobium sp.]
MHAALHSRLDLRPHGQLRVGVVADKLGSIAAVAVLCAIAVTVVLPQAPARDEDASAAGGARASLERASTNGRETLVAGYVAQPAYNRSDLHMTRSDGTDITLKALGWDGDALRFPIDGGVRVVTGSQSFAFMVDFLHNKAVSRLGRGA